MFLPHLSEQYAIIGIMQLHLAEYCLPEFTKYNIFYSFFAQKSIATLEKQKSDIVSV